MHAGLAGGAHLMRISWAVLGLAAGGSQRTIAPEPVLAPRNPL
jgi:hypothetical protein